MIDICKLDLQKKELKHSHIIPKFTFDYLKSTGSKYLRNIENPDIRHQDGTKEYLLCNDCEQLFSKRERWFANNIFFPYLKENKTEFQYDENLGYFVISMLWRVLINQLSHPSVKNEILLSFLKDVESEWREFLINFKYPINFNNLNIFFTDRLIYNGNSNLLNSDLYFTRFIDATIVHNNDFSKVAIYAKFLRFIFWAPVKGYRYENQTTTIKLNNGILNIPQELNDKFISSFFLNRIKQIDQAKQPNQQQTDKMWKEIEKNEKEFWDSDAGQSMLNDLRNFKQ
ncbi:hypothetical protein [Epilithonimonas zeae]|uniref:hypothetical protein n=1 Tax=Epilithonimonas zeae TaxID=1416779 RepID=UPI00200BB2E1|nr:hypothetical protein [Epilithonimonas zeae]UQB69543.1 hypothetical protein KI430_03710 [Epilithonimonas zeae]